MFLSSWLRCWKGSLERRWALRRTSRQRNVDRLRLSRRPSLEALEDRQLLSIVTVTTALDDSNIAPPPGETLRDAITFANQNANTANSVTGIVFAIPTTDPGYNSQTSLWTLTLQQHQLPTLTASGVSINGLNNGATSPSVVIDGSALTNGADGLTLQGSGEAVSGLIIRNFQTSSSGLLGNAIEVLSGSNNDTIGGTTTGAGNILQGNALGKANDGILINSGVAGTLVQGNYIGTTLDGASAFANKNGIVDNGSGDTIGGTTSAARNVISGNTVDGIDLVGSSNKILGNYIGTNASGSGKIANGVGVEVSGNGNTIGGVQFQGNCNIISGNTDGIVIDQGATGNAVQGNFIGTNAAGNSTTGLGNSDDGVKVLGSSNVIGGTDLGLGNVIDGSTNDGIFIGTSASGVLVAHDYIGVISPTHDSALANGTGVEIAGSKNTIGGAFGFGTLGTAGNIISGNTNNGILIDIGATGNAIQGDYIGLGAGFGKVANGANGIKVQGSGNTIGGTTGSLRNYIAGNGNDGVLLDTGATGNVIEGSYIGTTLLGQSGLGNGANGVEVASSGNVIGGSVAGANNVISGNSGDGVKFISGGSNNTVSGNYLGSIFFSATQPLANSNGIEDAGGGNNLIGGLSSRSYNIISGNTNDGVLIGSGVSGDLVQGNHIGTNATATSALSNSVGVVVQGSGNTIGGSVLGARNIISGNSGDGVLLSGSGNLVAGNYVGLKIDGQGTLGNSGNGIHITQGSNTIGGTVARANNYIAGNTDDGVLIDSGADSNLLQGNYIGLNTVGAAVANSVGVAVNSNSNTIGGSTALAARNYISGNPGGGVVVGAGSSSIISKNSIFANGASQNGPGIVNPNLLPPTISATYSSGTLTVQGTFTTTTTGTFVVEIFGNAGSTDFEGQTYIGSVNVNVTTPGLQQFSFTLATPIPSTKPTITATLTDPSGDTSAFSEGSGV